MSTNKLNVIYNVHNQVSVFVKLIVRVHSENSSSFFVQLKYDDIMN